MDKKTALQLALAILEPFKESSLYDDYQAEDGFSDDEYEEMLSQLRQLAEK